MNLSFFHQVCQLGSMPLASPSSSIVHVVHLHQGEDAILSTSTTSTTSTSPRSHQHLHQAPIQEATNTSTKGVWYLHTKMERDQTNLQGDWRGSTFKATCTSAKAQCQTPVPKSSAKAQCQSPSAEAQLEFAPLSKEENPRLHNTATLKMEGLEQEEQTDELEGCRAGGTNR